MLERDWSSLDETNYSLLLKDLYCREIMFTVLPKEKIDSKSLIVRRISILYGEGIKNISIGKKFTAILLYNDVVCYLKTEEF